MHKAVLADRIGSPGQYVSLTIVPRSLNLSNWLFSLAATGQIKLYRNNENLDSSPPLTAACAKAAIMMSFC